MKHYRLVYKQPHEQDFDSPSGIGDHQVVYIQTAEEFEAKNDINAREVVKAYLRQSGLNFGSHIGSPPAGCYPRVFVSLIEFWTRPDRVVECLEVGK